MLHKSKWMTFWEKQNYAGSADISGCQGFWEWEGWWVKHRGFWVSDILFGTILADNCCNLLITHTLHNTKSEP
jgi:hypothetical protein